MLIKQSILYIFALTSAAIWATSIQEQLLDCNTLLTIHTAIPFNTRTTDALTHQADVFFFLAQLVDAARADDHHTNSINFIALSQGSFNNYAAFHEFDPSFDAQGVANRLNHCSQWAHELVRWVDTNEVSLAITLAQADKEATANQILTWALTEWRLGKDGAQTTSPPPELITEVREAFRLWANIGYPGPLNIASGEIVNELRLIQKHLGR